MTEPDSDPVKLRAAVQALEALPRGDLYWLTLKWIPDYLRDRTRKAEVGWPDPVPFVDEVERAQAALDEAIARAGRMAAL